MITFLWYSDPHMDDVGPSSRVDNWPMTVLGKQHQIGVIAREEKASAVLVGGDFYHIKTPSRTSHRIVGMVSRLHRHYPCPVLCNVGNHDCRHSNYEFLPESPLGTLFSSGVFQPCFDDHEVEFQHDGVSARVVGIPYHGPKYDLDRLRRIKKKDEDHLIVMAHLLASPQGGTMFEGEDILSYKDLAQLLPDASVIAFGHWHKDQGITENIKGKQWIVNVGSLTRGSISEDNLNRAPCTVIIRLRKEGVELERRNLDVLPASKVFDLTRREHEEKRERLLNTFANALQLQLASQKVDKSPLQLIDESPLPQGDPDLSTKVRSKVRLYVEQASCIKGPSISVPSKPTNSAPNNISGPKVGQK